MWATKILVSVIRFVQQKKKKVCHKKHFRNQTDESLFPAQSEIFVGFTLSQISTFRHQFNDTCRLVNYNNMYFFHSLTRMDLLGWSYLTNNVSTFSFIGRYNFIIAKWINADPDYSHLQASNKSFLILSRLDHFFFRIENIRTITTSYHSKAYICLLHLKMANLSASFSQRDKTSRPSVKLHGSTKHTT